MGYPAQGEATSRRGLSHAEHLRHAISVVFALRRGCVEAMLRRDVARVKLLSARLLEVSIDYETFLGGPEGHLFHSWALLHERDDAAARERLQRSLDQLDETRTWALLPFLMASAAELCAARGDPAAARRLLVRAKYLGEPHRRTWCQPEIMRLEAAFLSDDPADKADLLYRAIELSREQGSHLWRLRAAIDLAELLRDQGQPDKARELLARSTAGSAKGSTRRICGAGAACSRRWADRLPPVRTSLACVRVATTFVSTSPPRTRSAPG